LKEELCFDYVTYSKALSQALVHHQFDLIREQAKSWNEDGVLLIFVYYMGNWCRPNAEIAYTCESEEVNIKQLTVELAANPKVHVVLWLEASLGVNS